MQLLDYGTFGSVFVKPGNMDVVYKVEAVGSQSGKPSKEVVITDSGELEM